MALPKKTYIQNCTGAQIESNGEKSANRIVSKMIFFVLLFGFFGVTGYVLFFSGYLKIAKINISGNDELKVQDLISAVETNQKGKILGAISKDNFLLVNDKDIEKLLLGQFKKIKTVSVEKRFPDTFEINLQERKALLVLCSGENCFLIDENGVAYSQADFNSPEIVQNHLIKISDKSSRDIRVGDGVMQKDYVRYALSLKDFLGKLDFSIDEGYWTPSLMADEIDVKMVQGGELYFSTQFSLESAIKTLEVMLRKEVFKAQQENISYIDLRTENKVFYKMNSNQATNDSAENKNIDENKTK